MPDIPTTRDPVKPRRRWYQFRLRTLLIGVVLLSIPLGYVGWQMKIVRERANVIAWLKGRGSVAPFQMQHVIASARPSIYPWQTILSDSELIWIRRLLGDHFVTLVMCRYDATDEEINWLRSAFPEAQVQRRLKPAWMGQP